MIGPAGGRRTGNLGGWAGFFPGRGSAQRVEKGEELTEPCRTVMRTASVRYVCSSDRTMNSTIAWDRNTHVRSSHLIELSDRRRMDSIPLPRTPLQSLPPCGRKDTARVHWRWEVDLTGANQDVLYCNFLACASIITISQI